MIYLLILLFRQVARLSSASANPQPKTSHKPPTKDKETVAKLSLTNNTHQPTYNTSSAKEVVSNDSCPASVTHPVKASTKKKTAMAEKVIAYILFLMWTRSRHQ